MVSTRLFLVLLSAFVVAVAGCATRPAGPASPRNESLPTVLPDLSPAVSYGAVRPDPVATLGPAESAATQLISDGPVGLRVTLSRATYGKPPAQNLLLKVDYFAVAAAPLVRPPLNIALVLDNSGSMAEKQKLPYTLEAARWVVENLTERDIVSIVAFSDRATVLAAAGRVVNKPFLFHRLAEISAQGYTNLSAGLLEGIAQADSQRAQGQVRQVLLLTDGLANRGETDAAALRNIAGQAKAKGIGVSTLGVGSEFNETLLADLAAAGGGRYVYVRTPEQIPAAFKDELRGLLQVVAQNAAIEVAVAGGGIGRVYGQVLDRPVSSYKTSLGDLQATERGFFLAELQPSRYDSGASVDVEVRLVLDDPQAGGRVSRVGRTRASYATTPLAGEDHGLTILAAVLGAVEQADLAARGLDRDSYRQVTVSFQQLYERAREFAIRNRDQELLNQAFVLKHFMGELEAAQKEGLLHGHREAQEKLKKESHYLRYLLTHHRPQP